MSKKVYCLGENTGCDNEDKPTLKECSNCPYMTTLRPRGEQTNLNLVNPKASKHEWEKGERDELLLTEILGFIESYLVTTVEPDNTLMHHIDDAEWKSVKARVIAKVKQHYEQDTASPLCNLVKSNFFLADTMRELAQRYIKPRWQQKAGIEPDVIPDIEELQKWYDGLLTEFKRLKRERVIDIEEAKKQENGDICQFLIKQKTNLVDVKKIAGGSFRQALKEKK